MRVLLYFKISSWKSQATAKWLQRIKRTNNDGSGEAGHGILMRLVARHNLQVRAHDIREKKEQNSYKEIK